MEYRVLGKTDIKVSAVGIGCLQFGGMVKDKGWTGVTDKESIATIHHAESLGVNLLDTALSYGAGHSEEVIGRAVHDRRDKYMIATKVAPITDSPNEKRAHDRIFESCESSLSRLQTDYIDIYQLHAIPHEKTMPTVMEALGRLKAEGKIRWYGISTNDVEAIYKLLALGEISVLQIGYNLLDRSGREALRVAREENLGTLIRVPLAKGILSGKYFSSTVKMDKKDSRREQFTSEEMTAAFEKLSDLNFLTEGTGRTIVQCALRFILDTAGVTSVIPGAKNRTQLESNAATASIPPMTPDDRARAMSIADSAHIPD